MSPSLICIADAAYALGYYTGIFFFFVLLIVVLRKLFSRKLKWVGTGLGVVLLVSFLAMKAKGPKVQLTVAEEPNVAATTKEPPPDVELQRLTLEARKQYDDLEVRRKTLKSGDAKAIEDFNRRAAEYKELLAKIQRKNTPL